MPKAPPAPQKTPPETTPASPPAPPSPLEAILAESAAANASSPPAPPSAPPNPPSAPEPTSAPTEPESPAGYAYLPESAPLWLGCLSNGRGASPLHGIAAQVQERSEGGAMIIFSAVEPTDVILRDGERAMKVPAGTRIAVPANYALQAIPPAVAEGQHPIFWIRRGATMSVGDGTHEQGYEVRYRTNGDGQTPFVVNPEVVVRLLMQAPQVIP